MELEPRKKRFYLVQYPDGIRIECKTDIEMLPRYRAGVRWLGLPHDTLLKAKNALIAHFEEAKSGD